MTTILEEADKLTSTDRQATYGHPRDHWEAVAIAATAYLRRRGLMHQDDSLQWFDWGELMTLDKVMRLANSPGHRDSLVDKAGYARAEEMGWQRK